MNLANKLTIFRMILVPIMVIIPFLGINSEILGIPLTYIIIDMIFIIASITDKLDGYIARSRNQVTTFGKFLDPIADKILVLAAMIMLVEFGKLPAWIPVIVLARELTKIHEEFIRGNIDEIIEKSENLKGEMILLIEGNNEINNENILNDLSLEEHYNVYEKQGLDKKEIIKKIAKDRGVNKNEIYQYFLKNK